MLSSILLLLFSSFTFSFTHVDHIQQGNIARAKQILMRLSHPLQYCTKSHIGPLVQISEFLKQKQFALSPEVINKVLSTLKCTQKLGIDHNAIVSIIDYSLPSSQKRLWVFDLYKLKLLYHTYVSHGITSGTLLTENFSNRYNSKATSLGVYRTIGSYYGRQGYSLRLQGLDPGFNDNAQRRYIVMHGGWYMEENFIKKYGRPGRSWGCPALPMSLTRGIIKTIKDNSLLIAYYPSDRWFLKSRYLNCQKFCTKPQLIALKNDVEVPNPFDYGRAPILFADKNQDTSRTENEPIVVMSADRYQQVFQVKAPLKRMLRRRIDNDEYIALTTEELAEHLKASQQPSENAFEDKFNDLYFVIPVVKNVRGYYKTEMHPVNLGKIKAIKFSPEYTLAHNPVIIVEFESKPSVHLRTTDHFIRWLGL